MTDGSRRFPDYETYVSRFQQEVERLVGEGFLLPDDAAGMVEAARQSDIGDAGFCP